MATPNVETMTPAVVEEMLKLNPSLRDNMISTLDVKIDELTKLRNALTGSRVRGRKAQSAGNVTDGRSHPDAIRHALSMKKFEAGATSRELREWLFQNGHPMNSGTLGTTLQNLRKAKEIGSKGKKGSKTYYLAE